MREGAAEEEGETVVAVVVVVACGVCGGDGGGDVWKTRCGVEKCPGVETCRLELNF